MYRTTPHFLGVSIVVSIEDEGCCTVQHHPSPHDFLNARAAQRKLLSINPSDKKLTPATLAQSFCGPNPMGYLLEGFVHMVFSAHFPRMVTQISQP